VFLARTIAKTPIVAVSATDYPFDGVVAEENLPEKSSDKAEKQDSVT
jgi:hypothetical protein